MNNANERIQCYIIIKNAVCKKHLVTYMLLVSFSKHGFSIVIRKGNSKLYCIAFENHTTQAASTGT